MCGGGGEHGGCARLGQAVLGWARLCWAEPGWAGLGPHSNMCRKCREVSLRSGEVLVFLANLFNMFF